MSATSADFVAKKIAEFRGQPAEANDIKPTQAIEPEVQNDPDDNIAEESEDSEDEIEKILKNVIKLSC